MVSALEAECTGSGEAMKVRYYAKYSTTMELAICLVTCFQIKDFHNVSERRPINIHFCKRYEIRFTQCCIFLNLVSKKALSATDSNYN